MSTEPILELLRRDAERLVRMRLEDCTFGYITDRLRESGDDVDYATVYRACSYIDVYDPDGYAGVPAEDEYRQFWAEMPTEQRVRLVLDGVQGALGGRWGHLASGLPRSEPRSERTARLRAAVEASRG